MVILGVFPGHAKSHNLLEVSITYLLDLLINSYFRGIIAFVVVIALFSCVYFIFMREYLFSMK